MHLFSRRHPTASGRPAQTLRRTSPFAPRGGDRSAVTRSPRRRLLRVAAACISALIGGTALFGSATAATADSPVGTGYTNVIAPWTVTGVTGTAALPGNLSSLGSVTYTGGSNTGLSVYTAGMSGLSTIPRGLSADCLGVQPPVGVAVTCGTHTATFTFSRPTANPMLSWLTSPVAYYLLGGASPAASGCSLSWQELDVTRVNGEPVSDGQMLPVRMGNGLSWTGSGASLTPDVTPACAITNNTRSTAIVGGLVSSIEITLTARAQVVNPFTSGTPRVNWDAVRMYSAINVPSADLAVTKSAPPTVDAQEDVTWTIDVTNHGPSDSFGFTVEDAIPDTITDPRIVSAPDGCSIVARDLVCSYASPGWAAERNPNRTTMAADLTSVGVQANNTPLPAMLDAGAGLAQIVLAGTAPAEAGVSFTNTATVSGIDSDPNILNNASSAATTTTQSMQIDKAWIILDESDNVLGTYRVPTQPEDTAPSVPEGFTATPVLSGQTGPAFGTPYGGYSIGEAVEVNEEAPTIPEGCRVESQLVTAANGSELAIPAELPYTTTITALPHPNRVTITNTVRCTQTLTLVAEVAFGGVPASAWTLTGSGPAGSLPGPSGTTGSPQTITQHVTPGVGYALTEDSTRPGAENYVPTDAGWQCLDGTTPVPLSGDTVSVAYGQEVVCTIVHTTASVTVLKHLLNPEAGVGADRFALTLTPPQSLGSAVSFSGSESPEPENTFEVRPGATYTLTERAVVPGTQYLALGVQRSTDGGDTWTTISGDEVTVEAGEAALYRLVNQSVPVLALPLTGGLDTDLMLLGAFGLLGSAAAVIAWQVRRGRRSRL